MKNATPPPKNGKVIDGKYVWDQSVPLPKYFKNGEEFIQLYLPNGVEGNFDFYMGDNEESLNKNFEKTPENWHYKTKTVNYGLNSLGYRSRKFDSYDWKNSIVVLGCSCVFGVGVDDSETLCNKISEVTGREVINLGVPGGSNQFLLDTSLVMKRKYGTPYSLIVMWTCTDRLPYYGDSVMYHIGLWNHTLLENTANHIKYKQIFDNIYEENGHENISFYNVVQSMRNIWEDKTKYFDGSFFEASAHYGQLMDYFPFSNTGRDLLHPGPSDHKNTAEQIVNHCIEKYGEDYMQSRGLGFDTKLL